MDWLLFFYWGFFFLYIFCKVYKSNKSNYHMKFYFKLITAIICCVLVAPSILVAQNTDSLVLKKSETLRYATLVNDYFMRNYPDVGANSYVGGKERNSKIWTRSVYYEGLMALYNQYPEAKWLAYAEDWGNFHQWISSNDNAKRHADFLCCGQAYLDLYMLKPDLEIRKTHIKSRIEEILATDIVNDWYWIDAIQMAMPIFAQLGSIEKDNRYFEQMYQMYMYTRNKHGGSKKGGGTPLFNQADGLWYRDYQYDPPYTDKIETDKPCYWSRGNGWVYMALARVLHYSPDTVAHKEQYISDFKAMSLALKKCQREDGFWSVSLAAPTNYGHIDSSGKETSGTALFVAGMAYGINSGLLDKDTYLPCVIRGWNAMCKDVVHSDGFLGYVQGAGACPEDGQPVLYDKAPDFEDFGIGCYLLAAAGVYQLGDIDLRTLSSLDSKSSYDDKFLSCQASEKELLISLSMAQQQNISLDILNMNGAAQKHLPEQNLSAGEHQLTIPIDLLPGIYVCVLRTSRGVLNQKFAVIR